MVVLHRIAPGPASSSLYAGYQHWAVGGAFWRHYTCNFDVAPISHHTVGCPFAAGKLCPKSCYSLSGANC
jgi:hypothetical protein